MTPAELLAPNLGALVHPGDGKPFPISIPVFRQVANPAMQEHFAKEAGLPGPDFNLIFAEAVEALIRTKYAIIPLAEVEQMQAAAVAAQPSKNRRLNFQCRCGYPIFTAQVDGFDTDNPTLPPAAIKAMHSIGTDCNTGHAVLHEEPR